MKVCFDLRALQIGHENRGIGMFAKSILEHMPSKPNLEYIFYAFDKNDPVKTLGIKFSAEYTLVQTETVKTALTSPKDIIGVIRLTKHRFAVLRKHRPDVFVQFDFNLGLPNWRKTKSVVIGYDLIPLIMRNQYLPRLRFALRNSFGKRMKIKAALRSLYYRAKYYLSYKTFKRANKIVSISAATTESFVKLLGIPKQRIHTIPLAPVNSPQIDESIANKINKPYIFYIGGTDSRKSVVDIVRAYNIVRGRGLDIALVLAGNELQKVKMMPDVIARKAIIESPYKDDIHLLGFVSDDQKKGLYKHAHAFVFCTVFEGFGLPIIEAMAAGCPVVSYNNSSIPEAAGSAAILVDTNDYVAVANALIKLQEPIVRQQHVNRGYQQSQKFTWQKYIKNFNKVIGI